MFISKFSVDYEVPFVNFACFTLIVASGHYFGYTK